MSPVSGSRRRPTTRAMSISSGTFSSKKESALMPAADRASAWPARRDRGFGSGENTTRRNCTADVLYSIHFVSYRFVCVMTTIYFYIVSYRIVSCRELQLEWGCSETKRQQQSKETKS